jgi:hypothetical protein
MNKNVHFGSITFASLVVILLMSSCKKDDHNASEQLSLSIGDAYAGGNIFYIDPTGQHGLVVATKDQSENAPWLTGPYLTFSTDSYDGFANTQTIVHESQGSGPYAAKLCKDYRGGAFTDWFLPSQSQLEELYLQKVGALAPAEYWSSTKEDVGTVWIVDFSNGNEKGEFRLATQVRTRAIRAF